MNMVGMLGESFVACRSFWSEFWRLKLLLGGDLLLHVAA